MASIKYREGYRDGSYTLSEIYRPVSAVAWIDDLKVSVNTGGRIDKPFNSVHKSVTGSILNSTPQIGYRFSNCPSAFYGFTPGNSLTPGSNDVTLKFRLLAHTNPARPEILLPNVAYEMRDLPDMIRQGGRIAHAIRNRKSWKNLIRPRTAVRDVAVANLAIQFGWLPFLSDLVKLTQFQTSMDRTKDKFAKLSKGKGLRAGMRLDDQTKQSTGSRTIWSIGGLVITVPTFTTETLQQWGVARWKPQKSFTFPQSDLEFTRRTLGLTPDSITLNVWESLPWSWLIDYFSNVGNVLGAQNHVVAVPISGSIMTRYTTTVYHNNYSGGKHSASGGVAKGWTNSRVPLHAIDTGPAAILGRIPVLSGSQLSVLGSLAVARAR